MRSVTVARRALLNPGLFRATYRSTIETPDGIFDPSGVPVLQLVERPAAFVIERARARAREVLDAATGRERLEVQKSFLLGELTREACRQTEDAIRRRRRQQRVG